MNFVKQATKLNNEGVSRMAGDENTKAMVAFQQSLALMKQSVNQFESEDDDDDKDMSEAKFAPLRKSPFDLSMFQSGPSYVYNHYLLLHDKDFVEGDTESVLVLSSAIILFNFALACHQQGLSSGREAALKKASQLYRLTVKLLVDNELHDINTTSLALVALNNRAQIHYDQCDYAESRFCIEEMASLMVDVEYLHCNLSQSD